MDPNIYGPPESTITTELVGRWIKDFMTVDEVSLYVSLISLLAYQELSATLFGFGDMNAGIKTEEAIHHRLP